MAKPVYQHRDKLGQDLNVDDCVAFPDNNSMHIGKITKLTPKMLTIKKVGGQWTWTARKYPIDLIRLDSEAVTLYLLKH
jgi:hypothetical protein